VDDFLSFKLDEAFFEHHQQSIHGSFKEKSPKWGFPAGAGNTLGEYSWLTKYSRKKPDGTRERFWEGLARVINGMYSIQKDYALHQKLPWNEAQAQKSAQEAYTRAFLGKWSPPGRGLWMMGTEMVNGRNDSSALQNCAFVSTENLVDDPIKPFMRLMDMSMLGVGVGFDTLGAGKVTIHDPRGVYPHSVGDSREGWVDSLGALLRSYLCGSRIPNFDYSRVRPSGAAIKGFGGVSSGPAPLRKLHNQISRLFEGRGGETLGSSDIVDIMNMAGKCVVSANVRRSAEIALGSADDEEFLALKDWNVNPERMGNDGWGHLSNNSVLATSGSDYSALAPRIALNGEPGIFWKDIAQQYGRLIDPPDHKEYRTKGVNPCGEQPLEPYELCTLVETFPTNCDDLQDYLRTLKFAYLYGKTVTLLMTRWPETNEVMIRNRRIGTSMTGIAQFAEEHGWYELRRWQDKGYEEIRKWDRVYSEWLGVRESIRVSTVKPSGTVSLLHGVTPGAHWPKERGFYVRTVREMKDSPIAKAMHDAGYLVEPSVADPDTTVVIYLPVEGPDIRSEREVSLWEKASLAATCQRMWSDNAVSVTLTFSEDEQEQVSAVLRAFDGQLKSVSFLPMQEGVYKQAPYQRASKKFWDILRENVKPIDWGMLYGSEDLPEAEGESYCTTDVCEIPR
jgi:ribonucleoside-triphosphate reductase (thioredoxin)